MLNPSWGSNVMDGAMMDGAVMDGAMMDGAMISSYQIVANRELRLI